MSPFQGEVEGSIPFTRSLPAQNSCEANGLERVMSRRSEYFDCVDVDHESNTNGGGPRKLTKHMSFERLKASIVKSLKPAETRVRLSNINDVLSSPNLKEAREFEDRHRMAAYGQIDNYSESGLITPEEAQRKKAKWDVMHGY